MDLCQPSLAWGERGVTFEMPYMDYFIGDIIESGESSIEPVPEPEESRKIFVQPSRERVRRGILRKGLLQTSVSSVAMGMAELGAKKSSSDPAGNSLETFNSDTSLSATAPRTSTSDTFEVAPEPHGHTREGHAHTHVAVVHRDVANGHKHIALVHREVANVHKM